MITSLSNLSTPELWIVKQRESHVSQRRGGLVQAACKLGRVAVWYKGAGILSFPPPPNPVAWHNGAAPSEAWPIPSGQAELNDCRAVHLFPSAYFLLICALLAILQSSTGQPFLLQIVHPFLQDQKIFEESLEWDMWLGEGMTCMVWRMRCLKHRKNGTFPILPIVHPFLWNLGKIRKFWGWSRGLGGGISWLSLQKVMGLYFSPSPAIVQDG